MKTLLIVFHSMTGGTLLMADAAADGAASEPEIRVRLLRAQDVSPADVLEADGYLFATPENLGAMSGMMDFFDRTYYAALNRIAGRPYAVLVCAGSDGENAARQIERIATAGA
jgi:multimeric flavodoxin WrbA